MKKRGLLFGLVFLCALLPPLGAQEFGFGFGDETGAGAASGSGGSLPPAVTVGGEVSAELLAYIDDIDTAHDAELASLGDIFSGALNLSASGANVDAAINLNLSGPTFADMAAYKGPQYTPALIDEAYLRAFFGPLTIEGGYRKLTWGKADSLGPLDVVNPLDYSDLTGITDIMAVKIARPMVHLSWDFGANTKLAAVFVPAFQGHTFATDADDRWYSEQLRDFPDIVKNELISLIMKKNVPLGDLLLISQKLQAIMNEPITVPNIDTAGLTYAQTGLRFTTTIGPADFGAQYYYGNFFRPSYCFDTLDAFVNGLAANPSGTLNTALLYPRIEYNRYHQLGVDYAQVIGGFNIRAEFAAHITEDLAGDDGAVKNPFLAWSLGFDRDLVWGITANIQCNETIRLLNDKIADSPALDTEAGTDPTSTRLTMQISRKFLRDDLEVKFSNIWDLENMDVYLIPAVSWTIKDVTAELSAGIFTGKAGGELSQYHKNNFIRTGLSYSF
ncbi:MAG: hypothetical protein LBE14_06620 [Treponema sp.]|jgi:hypothetical protein|nr:hypothetical protein [Treponema sp.]